MSTIAGLVVEVKRQVANEMSAFLYFRRFYEGELQGEGRRHDGQAVLLNSTSCHIISTGSESPLRSALATFGRLCSLPLEERLTGQCDSRRSGF